MNCDEETDSVEDEPLHEFDVMHALTGCMNMTYHVSGESSSTYHSDRLLLVSLVL